MKTLIAAILIFAGIASAQTGEKNYRVYTVSNDTTVVQSTERSTPGHFVYTSTNNLDVAGVYVRYYIPFLGAESASIRYYSVFDTTARDSVYTHVSYGAAASMDGAVSYVETLQDSARYWYGNQRIRAVNLTSPQFPAAYLVVDLSTSKGTTGANIAQWVTLQVDVRREK